MNFETKIIFPSDQKHLSIDRKNICLFPGSFNPVHFGHFEMAEIVKKDYDLKTIFWINTKHPDKGFVSDKEIEKRIQPILNQGYFVMLSENYPLYLDKIKLYSGFHFLIGLDAFTKMMFETPGKSIRDICLHIKDFYVKFIIFDRGNDGSELIQSKLPFWIKDHFIWKENKFNISSTEIRNASTSK